MDVHCMCGCHGHIDTDFAYFYECPDCHRVFEISGFVALHPLSDDLMREVKESLSECLKLGDVV
jgi:hypothetical protein